jgi:hypothetical protein
MARFHVPTKRERLEQAIIPLVNRGCTPFEIYDIILKASMAFRQDTGMSYDELVTSLQTFFVEPIRWEEYDGSYKYHCNGQSPDGLCHFALKPGKTLARCKHCSRPQQD